MSIPPMSCRSTLVIMLVLLCAPASLNAEPAASEEEHRSPGGTLFRGGDSVAIVNPVKDLFAAGRTTTLETTVQDNAFLGGRRVVVTSSGVVQGDLFAAGGTVRIDGKVLGDLWVLGQDVEIGEAGSVVGEVHLGGQYATLRGTSGPVEAAVQELSVQGRVAGDLLVAAESLLLDSAAARSPRARTAFAGLIRSEASSASRAESLAGSSNLARCKVSPDSGPP